MGADFSCDGLAECPVSANSCLSGKEAMRRALAFRPASRQRGAVPDWGRLAQLVERLLYTQDVGGSSPSSPTIPPCQD